MNSFENFQIIINLLKLFLVLLPIIFLGIIVLNKITQNLRLVLLIPAGIVLGLTLFTFVLNLIFNILPGVKGIWLSFFIIIIWAIALSGKIKPGLPEINRKIIIFWLIGFTFWFGLIAWKSNYALIGGDTRSYYAIAGTFIKGNYPPVTPWQPDVELAYHIGALELLGALSHLTNISFLPLHLILSVIFITCILQILVWIISEKFSVRNFIIANVAALIGFTSFGFLKIIYPVWPFQFPAIHNFNALIIWLRNLPSARESIELYGVSFNLDSLVYILFQNFGLAILFLIIVIILNFKKSLSNLILLLICLSTLALVNESIFVPIIFPVFLWSLFLFSNQNTSQLAAGINGLQKNLPEGSSSFTKKWISLQPVKISLLFLILGIFILFQGGLITAAFLSKDQTPSSIEVFPKENRVLDYLINSQRSRVLEIKDDWKPFGWVNIGIEIQLITVLAFLLFFKIEKKLKTFCLLLLGFSLGALATYNLIIPKYILSNSNRILSLPYQFLSIILVVVLLTEILKPAKYFKIRLTALIFFISLILIPTIIPPLAWMSTTRFGPAKLVPVTKEKSKTEDWITSNIQPSERLIILDVNSPHPSGSANMMALAGIKTPLFAGGFKTYTIEPGPEYTDITYSLNPESFKKLKITKLVIDDKYYQSLPEIRKKQLASPDFFELLFEENTDKGWKKIYRITPEYFLTGQNLEGSFEDLNKIAPKEGKFFIDSEKNFYLDFIRRPLIFTLRDRDLYFKVESGVYQHTETPINQKDPAQVVKYNYLVLSDTTNPESFCDCHPKLIWKYLNRKILLWKTN